MSSRPDKLGKYGIEEVGTIRGESALRKQFDAIKSLGFLEGLSDADIWELIRAGTWRSCSWGTTISQDGGADRSFYIVLSGVVGIERNGHQIDCLVETGHLSRARHSATVVARSDVRLMQVSASNIDRAAKSTQRRFHKVFVRTLSERLAGATDLVARQFSV